MEGRCLAEACRKSSKLHCTEIDEGKREKIFKYFWGKLEWKERKIYVKSLVEVSDVKRRRTEAVQSRRYNVDGSMEFKLLHSDNWQPFTSPSLRQACVSVAPLYTSPQKIKALKFKHLQELKCLTEGLSSIL
ncbi:unnamed protein product [Boreogadus saida]